VPDPRVGPALGSDAPPGDDREHADDFAELVTLLVARERAQLAAIQARLDDPALRRRDVGEILPEVLLQHALDPDLARALAPGVERAITTSVRQNPTPLADALFPVMGPAIRKAVASSLAAMVESLNRTLEQSVSWRSMVWRYEAFRTGKSFGEVVLLHTLLYRVEQVFLIERESGLLLQHVEAGHGQVRDVDMVSGMLTAIRDFVRDSFRVDKGDGLEALKVGELSVWVEQGPRAVLAAVLRGEAPRSFRERLQQAIEAIHLEFSEPLERFSGDSAVFEGARPILESCLQSEFRAGGGHSGRRTWLLVGAVLAGLAVWLGLTLRSRWRWDGYVDALRAEPGIVVTSSGRRGGHYVIAGLRDPLARDPEQILDSRAIARATVESHWEAYHAAQPALALARARQVLRPPDGATMELADGVLRIGGTAPMSWLADASRLAVILPGVTRVDASAAVDGAQTRVIRQIETAAPRFTKGETRLAAGQSDGLRQLALGAGDLQALAVASDRRFTLALVGHTDADGAPEANVPLSRARAEIVRAALDAVRGDRLEIVTDGVGSQDPVVESPKETDKQQNRRVTVHVTPGREPRAEARP